MGDLEVPKVATEEASVPGTLPETAATLNDLDVNRSLKVVAGDKQAIEAKKKSRKRKEESYQKTKNERANGRNNERTEYRTKERRRMR